VVDGGSEGADANTQIESGINVPGDSSDDIAVDSAQASGGQSDASEPDEASTQGDASESSDAPSDSGGDSSAYADAGDASTD
jgi:hypothetical protein